MSKQPASEMITEAPTTPAGPEPITPESGFVPGQHVRHLNGTHYTVRGSQAGEIWLDGLPGPFKAGELTIIADPGATPAAEALAAHEAQMTEDFRISRGAYHKTVADLAAGRQAVETVKAERDKLLSVRSCGQIDAASLQLAALGGKQSLLEAHLEELAQARDLAREEVLAVVQRTGCLNTRINEANEAAMLAGKALREAAASSPASRLAGALRELKEKRDLAVLPDEKVAAVDRQIDGLNRLGPVLEEFLERTRQITAGIEADLAAMAQEIDGVLEAYAKGDLQ